MQLTGESPPGGRLPLRPEISQDRKTREVFDYLTLWYDCFVDNPGDTVRLIAPSLQNLKSWFQTSAISCNNDPSVALPFELKSYKNCDQIKISIGGSEAVEHGLTFSAPGMTSRFTCGVNHCEYFKGRRVLLTMSKDNKMEWIWEWAEYYVIRHQADAVLLYDNGSAEYTADELLATIAGVPGIRVAVVVPWNFPYGPQGAPWDSTFCQPSALEHAKRRFLTEAASVLSCDIDEWVIDEEGESVFALCEASPTGYLAFRGRWCFALDDLTGNSDEGISNFSGHRYRYRKNGIGACPDKWAAVPSRIPLPKQWGVHGIVGLAVEENHLEGLEYRHFRGINTGWKNPKRKDLEIWDKANHEVDELVEREIKALAAHW